MTPLYVVPTPDLVRGRDLGRGWRIQDGPQPKVPRSARNDGQSLAESGMQYLILLSPTPVLGLPVLLTAPGMCVGWQPVTPE